MNKLVGNIPPDLRAGGIPPGSRLKDRHDPGIRAHRRGAWRPSFAAFLTVGWLLAAWLAPRAWLGPAQAAAQQPAVPPRQSPEPGATASATNKTPTFPKPLLGKVGRLPAALRKPAPASIDDLKSIEAHVKALVERVSPAVVAVTVGGAAGSAVVISEDGLVLCAAHVCGYTGRDVQFTFPDGKTARGKTLGMDFGMDSGLMKISGPGPWPHVPVGDLDRAQLGDWVLALGHPGGFDPQRPTVARLGRIIVLTPGLLQTDCTLLGGDSGGPLFDMSGRVIGIHSRISESTEQNFHVPISTFLETWDRLARGESWGERGLAPRAYIGASGVDDPEGCRLERIDNNSPAFRAGLKAGDIVMKLNGLPIKDSASFVQNLARLRLGAEVTLQIKRDGQEMSVRVTVAAGGRRGRGGFRGP